LYCCDATFAAVNAPDAPLRLTHVPGIGWTHEGKPSGFRFCPWCGEALPEDGFTGEFKLSEFSNAATEIFKAQPAIPAPGDKGPA
jgi:hypothetical protein